jgi:DNA (cytosine-5)-methyltransferase 1
MKRKYFAIDLFAGCGGLTQGLKEAGFTVFAAVEKDEVASKIYSLNHPATKVYTEDIRDLRPQQIKKDFRNQCNVLHLLAACPPCQGFSSLRRNNRKRSVFDKRNALIKNFVDYVEELKPLCIMLENVPGLENYYLFKKSMCRLRALGYSLTQDVLNVADFGVPQNRDRLIVLGSKLGAPTLALPLKTKRTVRDQIGSLPTPADCQDTLHQWVMEHTEKVLEVIAHIPKNGGSRKSLPKRLQLKCHQSKSAGFCDVYGRLRWDDVSVTITGGCLNPSKGRFLHPEQDRALTPREAALLQTFPQDYQFLLPDGKISKDVLALMIGNALPPEFCRQHSAKLVEILKAHKFADT